MGRIYVIGTADTKGEEHLYPRILLAEAGADAALFEAIADTVAWTETRRLLRLPHHINSPEFAEAAAAAFHDASQQERA